MNLQEIDVFIDRDGQVRIEVRGVKGGHCLQLTRQLEEALGGRIQSRELKADAYDRAQEQTPTRQNLGGSS